MNFNEYQTAVVRTLKRGDNERFDLNHMALGVAGESGELVDCIKKHTVYGKVLDKENLAEEIGDSLWYLSNICNLMGWDLAAIAEKNIVKLHARYPEKYTDELASVRLDK
jgi:NTP pyrophosphatase (non-canonical NTP hydrolase)